MHVKYWLLYLTTSLFLMKSTNARIAYFSILPTMDAASLNCLKSSGYLDEAFTYSVYNETTHNWHATTTPESINAAGTVPHVILGIAQIQWQSTIVQNVATYIARQFQDTKLKMIWLEPVNNLYYNNNITCAIVSNLARSITAKTRLQVGIFSNARYWVQTFGSQKACPELAALPLFNYESNKKPVPFGGWATWDFQYLQMNLNVCKKPVQQIRHN